MRHSFRAVYVLPGECNKSNRVGYCEGTARKDHDGGSAFGTVAAAGARNHSYTSRIENDTQQGFIRKALTCLMHRKYGE